MAKSFRLQVVFLVSAAVFAIGFPPCSLAQEQGARDLVTRFNQQSQDGDLAGCEATVAEMQARFPEFENVSQFEFELGRLQATTENGDPQKAREHLLKFVAGGVYAESTYADRARVQYGNLLARQGTMDQAKGMFRSIASADNLGLMERAYKAASSWGLVESGEDIAFWREKLGQAVAKAEERKSLGEQWVNAVPQSKRQRRQAILESDAEGLPKVRALLEQLEARGGDESDYAKARRQANAKIKSSRTLWEQGKRDESQAAAEQAAVLRASHPTDEQEIGELERVLDDRRAISGQSQDKPELVFRIGVLSRISSDGDWNKARACFEDFLTSGPYAEADCAGRARLQYAQMIAGEGRMDEAGQMLRALAGEPNLCLAVHAFKLANAWGFIEDTAQGGAWTAALETAIAGAQARLASQAQYLAAAEGPADARKRQARLRTEERTLPQSQSLLTKLRSRLAGESAFARLDRQARAKQPRASALVRLGRAPEARSLWREAAALRRQQIEIAGPLPASGPATSEQLKASVNLGVAQFNLGEYDACRALLEQALAHRQDPQAQPDANAEGARAIKQAEIWLVACEEIRGARPEELEPKIRSLVGGGHCSAEQAGWAFRLLAELARAENDAEREYLYLKDLKQLVRSLEAARHAARRLAELDCGDPELAGTLAQQHSPAYNDLAANGGIIIGEDGQAALKVSH